MSRKKEQEGYSNGSGRNGNGHNLLEAAMITTALHTELSLRPKRVIVAQEVEINDNALLKKINWVLELCGIDRKKVPVEVLAEKDAENSHLILLIGDFPKRELNQFLDVLSSEMKFECNFSDPFSGPNGEKLLNLR